MRQNARRAPEGPGFFRRNRDTLLALAVLFLAGLPFLAAAEFGFVAWDDDIGIENDPA